MRKTETPTEAFSTTTGKNYPSWAELIAEEANGFVVTVIITGHKGKVWPVTFGPFATQDEAERFRANKRAQFKRDKDRAWSRYAHQTYAWSVRPAWKPYRGRIE